jgi:hypothetical protein
VPELSDELIERVAEHAAAAPSPHSTVDVWYQAGGMARVGEEETAFANRSEPYLLGIEATWEEEPSSEEIVAWVREVFAELRSFSGRRIYHNFPRLLEEGKAAAVRGLRQELRASRRGQDQAPPHQPLPRYANIEPRS